MTKQNGATGHTRHEVFIKRTYNNFLLHIFAELCILIYIPHVCLVEVILSLLIRRQKCHKHRKHLAEKLQTGSFDLRESEQDFTCLGNKHYMKIISGMKVYCRPYYIVHQYANNDSFVLSS